MPGLIAQGLDPSPSLGLPNFTPLAKHECEEAYRPRPCFRFETEGCDDTPPEAKEVASSLAQ